MSSCGVDALPYLKAIRRLTHGLAFNLMVVGPSEIGKTTLIKSLFDTELTDPPETDSEQINLRIHPLSPHPNFKLTIIEVKGYGDSINRSENYKPIVDYIDSRYQEYSRDEFNQANEYNEIADRRVHCCLYMILPSYKSLKPIDLVTMKQLHQRVCLIPVIGQADRFTPQEQQFIKKSIMKQLSENGIEFYWPPLSVAASDEVYEENGKRHRVRSYPWGRMYIERDSDLPALRNLFKERILELIETTNKVHYKKFRLEEEDKFEELAKFKTEIGRERGDLLKIINRYPLK